MNQCQKVALNGVSSQKSLLSMQQSPSEINLAPLFMFAKDTKIFRKFATKTDFLT